MFKDDDTLVGTAAQTNINIPLTSYGYTENKFSGIASGSYYIKQSEAPAGYKLDPAEYPVTVNSDGSVSGSGFHDGALYNKTMSVLSQTLYFFINSETASVTVNKDGSPWTGLDVELHGSANYDLAYFSGSYSSDEVYYGSYDIYVEGADTGENLSVQGGSSSATIDYYTVTYNENNESPDTVETAYLGGEVTAAGQGDFEKTGYGFAGWNTDPNGGGTQYTEGQTFEISAPLTLYAQWTAGTTNVTLDPNDGASGNETSVSAVYDFPMPALTDAGDLPTRTNYSFTGYYDAQTGGVQYYDETGASVKDWDKTNATATLYAQWELVTYTVTVNNGTCDGGEYTEGATVTITADTPVAGKQFKEWTTSDAITFADASSAITTFSMPAGDVSVTATYEDISVTGIAIKTQPQLEYNEGQALDLSSIETTVTYSDGTTEDCGFGDDPTYGGGTIQYSPANGTILSKASHDGQTVTVTLGSDSANTGQLNVKSTNAGVTSVTVEGTAGTRTGNTFDVVLPYGSTVSDSNTVAVVKAEADATASTPVTADDGATWTFSVTAEDGTTTAYYTVNVTVAPNPNAGNMADVTSAQATIEDRDWIVAQATANTPAQVKAWIEQELSNMNLNGVSTVVSMDTPFTAAVAGTLANNAGSNGAFSFTVALSKGSGEEKAEGTAADTGTITATVYVPNPSVTVTASAENPIAFGGSVTLSAETDDILSPAYQWYSNTQNSTTGGTLLVGETGDSYDPYTRTAGTKYYYCVVNGTISNVAAVTVENGFTVAYDANTGAGGPSDSQEYADGDSVNVKFTPAPDKTEHTFLGWATSDSAAVPDYALGGTTSFDISSDTTLYAVWELKTYGLTVVNGTDNTNAGPYAKGAEVSITADAASAEQVFDKWTTADGGSFADENSQTTTYTMPGNAAEVTATYTNKPIQYGLYRNDYPAGESRFTVSLPYDGNGDTDVAALKAALFDAVVNMAYNDASGVTVYKSIAGLTVSDVAFVIRQDVGITIIDIPITKYHGTGTYTIKCSLNSSTGYSPSQFEFSVALTDSRIQASISLPGTVSGDFSEEMPGLADAIRTAVINAIDTQNSVLPENPDYTVEYKNDLGIWISLDGVFGVGEIGKGTHEIRVTLEESATHTSAEAFTSVTVGSKGTISVNYAEVGYATVEGTQIPVPNYITGAEFALFHEDGTPTGITAAKSERAISVYGYEEQTFGGLAAGSYYIKQTAAPEGYKLDTKEYHFTVNDLGEITAPAGEDYIKSYMSAYAIEKFEYLSIPLFDNEKVQTTEGLYRNEPDSYTIGLPIDANGLVMLDTLKAAIFDAVVDTDYSAVNEYDDIIKSIEGLSVSDVLIMVDYASIGIYSEINALIGEGTYDAKIALVDAQDYYPNEITFELVLTDNRIAANIVLSEIDDIVYSENLAADIQAAVEAAIDESSELPENPVISIEHNIGTDDIPIWVSIDNTNYPLNVGTYNVRVRSEATVTHTAGQTYTDITIVPGQGKIKVNSASITYGDPIPSSLVVTDPASLKTAVIYAGINIDADPYVSIVLPDNLNILNDPVLWGLKQLLDLQQVSVGELEDTLSAIGIPDDMLSMIFDNIPEEIKDIRVYSSAPSDAGAYLVVAANVDRNYEANPSFGILAILMDIEGHELRWNQDVENYFINVSLELDTFDFGASYFVDDVEDTGMTVKYKFFGVGRDGAEYSETPPTDIGAYTQIAYVGIDNEFAYPIVRAFVVGDDVADIDVACQSILVGEPLPQMVTTDPAGLDTLTIYVGVNDDADAYIGIVYPDDTDSLIGDMIFDQLSGMDADTLRSLLISIGIPADTINNLFALIPPDVSVMVTKSAPDTSIAGAYIVGAMVIAQGYLPAMDIGALAVMKQSEDVTLSWNEEINGYFIKRAELGGFDFSATCYVEGEQSDAVVKYKFLGAGQNGADFTETPPTETGVYTQIAYIIEDDIITLPIMRTFAVVDEDADVDVACESILVGDPLPQMVTTDPAGLDTITIYAGVNDDAEAFVGVVYPGDADSAIGDIIFDSLNGMNVNELRELLISIGIPADTINNLFAMLPSSVGTVTIARSAPDTDIAGVYIVGAMVIEDGYVPAMGIGALAVMKQSEDVELRWNEDIGYFINSLDVDGVDYTAACFVEGEQSDAVVQYKFFGVGQDGAGFTSTHPTAPGVYTQIAYIIEDDIITLPLFRTYAVVDECADIDVACTSILVGDPLPQMVTTDPAGLDTLTIYAGMNENADAFVGLVYPRRCRFDDRRYHIRSAEQYKRQ